MEKHIEHSPKPQTSNGIHYWDGAILPEELSEFQDIVRELLSGGGRKGLYFEKLETGSKKLKLYSVRINQEMRLLLTEQKTDSGNILIALAITKHYKGWEHDADNIQKISTCLKRMDKNFTSLASLAVKPLSSKKQQSLEAELSKPAAGKVVYFSGNFLSLKPDQKNASQMRLPGLLLGLPGTGKTVTAVECLQALHQSHPDAKLYYSSSLNGLVSEVSQTFAVQYPDIQVTFSPLHALLEGFFDDRHQHLESAGLSTLSHFLQGQRDAKKQKNIRNQKRSPLRFQLSEKALVSEKIYELLQLIAFYEHQAHVTLAHYLKRESGLELDVLLSDLRLYRAYLQEHKLYDWGISNPPTAEVSTSSNEHILVLDEAQNVPPLVLYSLRQIFAHRMLGVGDPYQALSYQPMDLIWGILQEGLDWRILNQSLRCPAPIVLAAQHVLGLLHVVGGAHIKGYGGYDTFPQQLHSAVQSVFKTPSDFTGVHVIFARPDLRAVAEKTYGALTPFIHDVEDVGGLTFGKVVLCGFFEPKHLNALSTQDYQAASKAILTHNPNKNSERRADLEAWLHRLLVAMTRATESLFMGITGKTEAERRFMQYLGVEENALKASKDISISHQSLASLQEPYTELTFSGIYSEMEKMLQDGALHLAKRNFDFLLKQKRLSRIQVKTLESLFKKNPDNAPVQSTRLSEKAYMSSTQDLKKDLIQSFMEGFSQDDQQTIMAQVTQNAPEQMASIVKSQLGLVMRVSQLSTRSSKADQSAFGNWGALTAVREYLLSVDTLDEEVKNSISTLENKYCDWVSENHHSIQNLLIQNGDASLLACFIAYEVRQGLDLDKPQDRVIFKLFQQHARKVVDNGRQKCLGLQYWFECLAVLKKNSAYQARIADFEQRLFSQFSSEQWMDLLQDSPMFHRAIKAMPKSFFVRYLPVFWANAKAKKLLSGNSVLMQMAKKRMDNDVAALLSCRRSNMRLMSFLCRDAADLRVFYLPDRVLNGLLSLARHLEQGTQPINSGILTSLFSPSLQPYLWGPIHDVLGGSSVLLTSDYAFLVTRLIDSLQVGIDYNGRMCSVWEACLDLEPLFLPKHARNNDVRFKLHSYVLAHLRKANSGNEKNPLHLLHDAENPCLESFQYGSMFLIDAVKDHLHVASKGRPEPQIQAACSNLFKIISSSRWPKSPVIQWHEFLHFRDAIEAGRREQLIEVYGYFADLTEVGLWKSDKKSFALVLLAYEELSKKTPKTQEIVRFMTFFERHFLTLETLMFILENQYPFLILNEPELPKTCERILLNLSPEVVFKTNILFCGTEITLFNLIYSVLDFILEPWLQKNRQILSQCDNSEFKNELCKPDILILMFKKFMVFREVLLSYVENNIEMCRDLTEQDIEECDFLQIDAIYTKTQGESRQAIKGLVKAALEVLRHHPKVLNQNALLRDFFNFYTDRFEEEVKTISTSPISFFSEPTSSHESEQVDQNALVFPP